MSDIEEKIKTNILKIEEYYNISFEVLQFLVKKNKFFVFLFFLIRFFIGFISEKLKGVTRVIEIFQNFTFRDIENYWLLINIFLVLVLIFCFLKAAVIKKTGIHIEKSDILNMRELMLKFIKLFSVSVVLFLVLSIIFSLLWIVLLILYFIMHGTKVITFSNLKDIQNMNLVIIVTGILFFIIFIIKALYFIQIYYIRDLNVFESLVYSFHLSKKNKRKIVLSVILLFLLKFFITIPLNILKIVTTFSHYKFLIIGVISLIDTFFYIFFFILITVIYLNVEYSDLQNVNSNKLKS